MAMTTQKVVIDKVVGEVGDHEARKAIHFKDKVLNSERTKAQNFSLG